jgi:hypothetical protein
MQCTMYSRVLANDYQFKNWKKMNFTFFLVTPSYTNPTTVIVNQGVLLLHDIHYIINYSQSTVQINYNNFFNPTLSINNQ